MKTLQLLTVILFFSTLTKAQSFVDFTLPSVTDTSHFTLSKAKGKFIALHFLLKTGKGSHILLQKQVTQTGNKLRPVTGNHH